jgi:uncharacterized protein YndB with AHSA1/START domain
MSHPSDRVMTNIENDPTEATLEEGDQGWVLTMSREFAHPPERVWRMLTDPEQLVLWSPVVPDRPLTRTGAATSRETPDAPAADVEVLVADAPRELVHRWGPQLLRWRLTPTGQGCRLTLAHTFPEGPHSGMFAAGWHICFAVLRAVLDDQPVDRVVGEQAELYGWAALRERYDEQLPV